MIASEIVSGKPRGQTYADAQISLLVESANATELVGALVEKITSLASPTLVDLTKIVDQYFARETTIALLVQSGANLHVLSRGGGTIFLKRNDKAIPLVSSNASASGPVGKDDVFILAGRSFLDAVTPSVFTILLGKTRHDEVEDKIVAYLEQNTQTDALCLLLYSAPQHNGPIIHELPSISTKKLRLPSFNLHGIFSSFSPHSKQQKITIVAGTVLLLLLVASLVFGSRERARIGTVREFEEMKATVLKQISDAEQLIDLAPDQAAPLLTQTSDVLRSHEEKFSEPSPQNGEFTELVNKVDELLDRAHRKYNIEPVVFFDITWIKDTAIGKRFVLSETSLFILDTDNGAVYEIGLSQKKSTILGTNEQLKNGVSLSLFQGNPYSFVEGSTTKMINTKGDEAIAHNDSWGQVVDSQSFGGNIYLLDRNNQIWKHPGSESGFGSGSAWLVEDAVVDFSKANSFAIDGNIWVLSDTTINKLAVGGQDSFFLKGETLTNAKKIWTSEDSKYLYILEDTRIVVFDKNGNYREQYIWDGLQTAEDFAISEPLNKILILQKDKVYSIDRK